MIPAPVTKKEKGLARHLAFVALQEGFLVRPEACEGCGAKPDYKLHGHHRDYRRPVDVEWLCRACHGQRHRAVHAVQLPETTAIVRKLRKSERRQAIDAGIIRTVARETGFTAATVSRTFAGKFRLTNKVVVDALNRFLDATETERNAA